MGHCQPARHNNRQLTAYEKVLLFSGLTIAGSCGELGELVSDGLIIRLSQIRVLGAHQLSPTEEAKFCPLSKGTVPYWPARVSL